MNTNNYKIAKENLKDVEFGLTQELIIQNTIKKHWDIKDLKQLDFYNPLDFYASCKDIYFEIKTRRINHNSYDTTMVGQNKINYAIKLNKPVYFIFVYNDGIYYYEFNEHDEIITSKGGRCDRGRPEFKQYVFIPITKLIKI